MASVVLLGTLDTKGAEYEFLRDRVRELGCDVILVDAGVLSDPSPGDVTADEVAAAAGESRAALAAANDRGPAVLAMTRGATEVVKRLYAEGKVDGVLGVGGSGGSSIVSAAMQALPVGVPKMIVSTMALGRHPPVRRHLRHRDDVLGRRHRRHQRPVGADPHQRRGRRSPGWPGPRRRSSSKIAPKPLIGATMFGVTTPCVTTAREWLEAHGYEVLVFHATGAGGRVDGSPHARRASSPASLDITTTELVDELVGGVLSAGPDRLEMAGALGHPPGRLAGRPRHVQLRPAETGPGEVRRPQPLRAQRRGHADAHDRGGVRRAGPDHRPQAQRGDRPADRLHPARRRLDDRHRRAVPSTTRPPTRPSSGS